MPHVQSTGQSQGAENGAGCDVDPCQATASTMDVGVVGDALALARQFSRSERLLLCLRFADGLNEEEISVLTRSSVAEVRLAIGALVDRVRRAVAIG